MEKIDLIMKNFIAELGYEPANAMFARINSGKKLRSKLLLKIAGESEQSLKICAIIELIHLASLLHDDVIDDANTKREFRRQKRRDAGRYPLLEGLLRAI